MAIDTSMPEKPRFKCFHCGQPYIYKCAADCSNDPSIPGVR
jgi:hypothetical protein|tara:strand:- start:1104 stop:1226 length:123 start_codon:yes stop_codon:yes gene_type:complete